MKLIEALELFLNEYDNAATRRAYVNSLLPFVKWIGERDPQEVEEVDLVRYLQKVKPSIAEATLEKHKKALKTFFLWMERMRFIEGRNPVKAIKQHRLKTKVRKDKAMTDEELFRLLDFVRWFPRNHAVVQFLAKTGCRAGGASTLKISDLDLEGCRATVTEKGNVTREVMYDEEAAAAIRTWLIQRPAFDNDFVFVIESGKPMSPTAISQMIRRACIKVGNRSLGSHSLRHRIGYKFAEERLSPTITQAYLGHTDVQTTLRNYYPTGWEHAVDTIRDIISTSSEKTTHQRIIDLHKRSSNA